MNEGFKAVTAQDLIKMYNLDALVTERKQTKARNEEIKNVYSMIFKDLDGLFYQLV